VRFRSHRLGWSGLALLLCAWWQISVVAQEASLPREIPDKFNLDVQTAARLRPTLRAESTEATGQYPTGRLVFDKLLRQLPASNSAKVSWELRIVSDNLLNAYSSPDGTVYVESGLAHLAGMSAGLWAAILSHEIAHVVRRDWARRYLYQKAIGSGGAGTFVLGDPGIPSGAWRDASTVSEEFASFCRQMELDADRTGLILMSRAGYHPDFVPALHHLLRARSPAATSSVYAMHPRWETRDRELEHSYITASIEFDRLWPERYASPGGDPPVVVFTEEPSVKKTGSRKWEVRIPMRCQNLVGAVEVVLLPRLPEGNRTATAQQLSASNLGLRQLTGCTSPRTTVTFTFTDPPRSKMSTDVVVLDGRGSLLSRAPIP
jgi:Zn-dependent protease with chaperone function